MIYDVFPFFNELDLLDIRLNVHAPYVDRFILVEAHRTHSGNPKPLYYADNKHLFESFNNRINHVICNFEGRDTWCNEMIQLNDAVRGMPDLKDEDIITFGGLDEIFDFRNIGHVTGVHQVHQKMYHYYLNLLRGGWDFPKVFTGAAFKALGSSFNSMRHYRVDGNPAHQPFFANGGWHFSFMGGPARIKEKLEAYLHQEFNQPHITDLTAITERIKNGEDVLCRGAGENWWTNKVEINEENHPKYVVENQDKFRHLILA